MHIRKENIPAPNPHIESLRANLHDIAGQYGDLLHPEVLRASQELDRHIVRHFQNQLKMIAQTSKG